MKQHVTTIHESLGAVSVEIVALSGAAVHAAGNTQLELARCADGTLILAASKPDAAPISVGFRLTPEAHVALAELLAGATP